MIITASNRHKMQSVNWLLTDHIIIYEGDGFHFIRDKEHEYVSTDKLFTWFLKIMPTNDALLAMKYLVGDV